MAAENYPISTRSKHAKNFLLEITHQTTPTPAYSNLPALYMTLLKAIFRLSPDVFMDEICLM
ncbi:hypothetical protein BJP43_04495 [Candidatus Williamhamiltonella defendens]|uniref:Uncharacterized protein n=1 Tax=Candidatus Williamhamiltonella defendens TaxID=138072 RepID=A0A2D3TCY4_9ENTR|nr:hypothetical protein BJP43_04495 [Candidatus Hamiltonella defensa]